MARESASSSEPTTPAAGSEAGQPTAQMHRATPTPPQPIPEASAAAEPGLFVSKEPAPSTLPATPPTILRRAPGKAATPTNLHPVPAPLSPAAGSGPRPNLSVSALPTTSQPPSSAEFTSSIQGSPLHQQAPSATSSHHSSIQAGLAPGFNPATVPQAPPPSQQALQPRALPHQLQFGQMPVHTLARVQGQQGPPGVHAGHPPLQFGQHSPGTLDFQQGFLQPPAPGFIPRTQHGVLAPPSGPSASLPRPHEHAVPAQSHAGDSPQSWAAGQGGSSVAPVQGLPAGSSHKLAPAEAQTGVAASVQCLQTGLDSSAGKSLKLEAQGPAPMSSSAEQELREQQAFMRARVQQRQQQARGVLAPSSSARNNFTGPLAHEQTRQVPIPTSTV